MNFLKYINPLYYINLYIDKRAVKVLGEWIKIQNKEHEKLNNYFFKKSNSEER